MHYTKAKRREDNMDYIWLKDPNRYTYMRFGTWMTTKEDDVPELPDDWILIGYRSPKLFALDTGLYKQDFVFCPKHMRNAPPKLPDEFGPPSTYMLFSDEAADAWDAHAKKMSQDHTPDSAGVEWADD
jgi:hypothetical protein